MVFHLSDFCGIQAQPYPRLLRYWLPVKIDCRGKRCVMWIEMLISWLKDFIVKSMLPYLLLLFNNSLPLLSTLSFLSNTPSTRYFSVAFPCCFKFPYRKRSRPKSNSFDNFIKLKMWLGMGFIWLSGFCNFFSLFRLSPLFTNSTFFHLSKKQFWDVNIA